MLALCTLGVPSIQFGCSASGQKLFCSVILSVMALSLACGSAFGWAGGGCFLPETPILLADGSSIPISEVKPGMRLLAFDERGRIVETVVRDKRKLLVIAGQTPRAVFYGAVHAGEQDIG